MWLLFKKIKTPILKKKLTISKKIVPLCKNKQ